MKGRGARRGFTLFEVILSLAILGLAMGVISQVIWSGMENARITDETVQAQLLAENVMAEVLAGIRTMESVDEEPFDDDSGLEDLDQWVFSIEVTPMDGSEELNEVRVTVRMNTDKTNATSFTLVRWVLVPETEETEVTEEPEETEEETS